MLENNARGILPVILTTVRYLKKLDEKLSSKYLNIEKGIYDRLSQVKDGKDGLNGIAGKNGRDGKDGKDGKNGKDGDDGIDGISVVDASIDIDNAVVFKLSNGKEIDAGTIYVEKSVKEVLRSKVSTSVMQEPVYTVRYDEVSSTVAYKGDAVPNSTEASSVWRIRKIVITNGVDVTITWASGNENFDKVWNDRLTYTYS